LFVFHGGEAGQADHLRFVAAYVAGGTVPQVAGALTRSHRSVVARLGRKFQDLGGFATE
jgi:hypothetical protein